MAFKNYGAQSGNPFTPTEEAWVQTGATGIVLLKETTAPTATTSYGKIYVKSSDHKLYFLNASGVETDLIAMGSGTVTSVSVVSANGFAGTVATATTTPAITLTTTVTGVLKGNGTAISAATSGTDYSAGTSALATGILKSTTTTGALSIAVSGTDYSAGTSALATGILKSTTGTGALSIAVADTDYLTPTTAASTYVPYTGATTDVNLGTHNIFGNNIVEGFTSTATAGGITTLTVSSTEIQSFTGVANQTLVLPNATTLTKGHSFRILNPSTGNITIQTNGGATLWTMATGTEMYLICTDNSTAAGTWETHYIATSVSTGKRIVFSNSLTFIGADAQLLNFGTNNITLTTSGATSLTLPTSGTVTALGNTTTGSGSIVLATSPTLVTPTIGVATATSINKVALTAPTTAATLAFGTDNATITFQGTDTYVGRTTTDTLTNKDLSSITNTGKFWTLGPGTPTRASNTTFTMTGDYTSVFAKGVIIKWTETSTVRNAMVSIPSTYSAPNTTVTIVGDTMASIDASSLKYAMIGAEVFSKRFALAGTIGATGTDVANAYYAEEPYRVFGADLQVGTAGTTNNTTIDLMKNGTTMFTTKPTLATTVASSPTPFTADTATSLALGDRVRLDVTAVQTTPAIDLYVQLYVMPTRYNNL